VVNPGIWMPEYNHSRWNAVFFVTFIIVGVFYLHSLVLSVVFQVFIQSATEVHRRSVSDKEQSMRLAFLSLESARYGIISSKPTNDDKFNSNANVDPRLIEETLHILRPRYTRLKLKVLMDILIPSGNSESGLDFSDFRVRMRQALNSSIRETRSHTTLGLTVEILAVVVAVLNFLYVILLTSNFQRAWFVKSEFFMGSCITLLALLEAFIRYNPLKASYRINSISRLNAILDGIGAFGACLSLFGKSCCS
jgi:hypothetical protein